MRLAIVHDFLTQKGGAERVVLHLAATLRDPVIATSLYCPSTTYPEFADLEVRAGATVGAAAAQHFRRHPHRYWHWFRQLDLSSVDFVIISSSAFAHHLQHPRSVVYWHTTPRYLYEPAAYVRFPPALAAFRGLLGPLRRPDSEAARAHLGHAANSLTTAKRLERHYGLAAPLIHPPLDLRRVPSLPVPAPPEPAVLVVSRLLPYKRVDLAIRACERLNLPLTIVGTGPSERSLRAVAGPRVKFVGRLSEEELAGAFASHSLVLCPGVEDLGYLPIEANAHGRPVVAPMAGGALETVIDGVTGELVGSAEPADWAAAISNTLSRHWEPSALKQASRRFGGDVFDARLSAWLSNWIEPSAVMRTKDVRPFDEAENSVISGQRGRARV